MDAHDRAVFVYRINVIHTAVSVVYVESVFRMRCVHVLQDDRVSHVP
jgi:hypothetical protein